MSAGEAAVLNGDYIDVLVVDETTGRQCLKARSTLPETTAQDIIRGSILLAAVSFAHCLHKRKAM